MNDIQWVETITVTGELTFRFANGTGRLTINGNEYQGTNGIVRTSANTETAEFVPQEFVITLYGTNTEVMRAALNDNVQGYRVQIDLYKLNLKSGGVYEILEQYVEFKGVLSHSTIKHDYADKTADISYIATYDNAAHDNRPETIYSSATQKLIDPIDTAFDRLPEVTQQDILWGRGRIRGY